MRGSGGWGKTGDVPVAPGPPGVKKKTCTGCPSRPAMDSSPPVSSHHRRRRGAACGPFSLSELGGALLHPVTLGDHQPSFSLPASFPGSDTMAHFRWEILCPGVSLLPL